ncbi:arylsulfatase [Arenibacter sp. 6A1]|uniref:arylsulfatase n=1 Tax=Arenibacter sp. 6A1 TaxID=2720391 RepID=UPI00144819A7|nr:arylsulfatase [Arenibacter sp. 6A1]NKI27466.1 arylsulfatase [Arenibacter sp. 6A1]
MKNIKNMTIYKGVVIVKTIVSLIIVVSCQNVVKNTKSLAPTPPNIVYIMADDLGYNHLGAYGQRKIKTPNIDNLAQEGIRFTQFYAGASVCGPSRTSLMLGLHTGHVPYRENRDNHLAKEYAPYGKLKTLGQIMKEAGYETGYFGKYGIGGPEDVNSGLKPNDIGFDNFMGLVEHGHGHFHYPAYIWYNKEKYLLNNITRKGNRPYGLSGTNIKDRREHTDDVFSLKAIEFIEEKAKTKQPFFCFLSFSLPHAEMLANEKFVEPYKQLGWEEYNSINNGYHVATSTPKANFAGMVSQVDYWIGEVIKVLEKAGISENTLVIFTSDNGGQMRETWGDVPSIFFEANGKLKKGKTWNYEGGIRVPMIAKWPEKIKPNTVSDYIGYFPDFMPTFAEIAYKENLVPQKIDGISFVDALMGKDNIQKQHEYLYWELPDYVEKGTTYEIHKTRLRQAIRFGKWKVVREDINDPIELYNLNEDIGEQNNLAENHPDVVAKALEILKEAHLEPKALPLYN